MDRYVTFKITDDRWSLDDIRAAKIICRKENCKHHKGGIICGHEAPVMNIKAGAYSDCASYFVDPPTLEDGS